jgi:hypothetical protein
MMGEESGSDREREGAVVKEGETLCWVGVVGSSAMLGSASSILSEGRSG